MELMEMIKNRWSVYFLILCFGFAFSCNKNNEELAKKEASKPIEKEEKIDESNLNESAEDLMKVDYKEFYDELAPHGQWIQVKAADLGIDTKKMNQNAVNELHKENSIFGMLAGVNNAYANDVDVDLGMFFVWQPAPELAVGVTTTNATTPVYVPYTNGQWVNTDAGWYFAAPTPYEDVTMHYGRWAYTDDVGWVWMPGRVWSPAWVDWRYGNDYVAWAPLPPGAVFVDNVLVEPVPIVQTSYVVVPTQYFIEPQVYTYMVWDPVVRQTVITYPVVPGLVVTNNVIINQGPEVTVIQNISGRVIEKIKINRVENISNVKFTDKEVNTFTKTFVRDKSDVKRNLPVSEPKSFKEFSNVQSTAKNENREPKQPGAMTDQKNKNKEQVQKDTKGGAYKNNNGKTEKFSNKNYNKEQSGTVKKNSKGNNKQYNGKSGNQNKTNEGYKNKGNGNKHNYDQPQQKQKQQPQTKQKDQSRQNDHSNQKQTEQKQGKQPQDKGSGHGNENRGKK